MSGPALAAGPLSRTGHKVSSSNGLNLLTPQITSWPVRPRAPGLPQSLQTRPPSALAPLHEGEGSGRSTDRSPPALILRGHQSGDAQWGR